MSQTPRAATYRTKLELLIAMITRPEGASSRELQEALGWAPHTVRGCISAQIRGRMGWAVVSRREGERGTVYRVPRFDVLGGAA